MGKDFKIMPNGKLVRNFLLDFDVFEFYDPR